MQRPNKRYRDKMGIQVWMSIEMYRQIEQMAERDKRSRGNMIAYIIEQYFKENGKTNKEMAE